MNELGSNGGTNGSNIALSPAKVSLVPVGFLPILVSSRTLNCISFVSIFWGTDGTKNFYSCILRSNKYLTTARSFSTKSGSSVSIGETGSALFVCAQSTIFL